MQKRPHYLSNKNKTLLQRGQALVEFLIAASLLLVPQRNETQRRSGQRRSNGGEFEPVGAALPEGRRRLGGERQRAVRFPPARGEKFRAIEFTQLVG